jgi:hypothetical protein
MSLYQTRHTIINNEGGKDSVALRTLKEDADYFKYDVANGDRDPGEDKDLDEEEQINTHAFNIDTKLLSTDEEGRALLE